MAKMYPSFGSIEELERYLPANEYGNGKWWERVLYDVMRDELPDDWIVIHHRHLNDGFRHEYDFLVIVPGKGIVNLDAKGYGWRFDGNMWYRERKLPNGKWEKEYDDPIDQAEKALKTFNNLIYATVSDKQPWGGYGYLLVFAEDKIKNKLVEKSYMSGAEKQIKTGKSSWGMKLKEKLNQVLNEESPMKLHHFFTTAMQKRIVNTLVPKQYFVTYDDCSFRCWDAKSRNRLSLKQERVSAELRTADVVHVVGAAGTGKTVVALALLEEYRKDGKKALYVCFNKALCSVLKADNTSLTGSGDIVFANFDALPSIVLPGKRNELRKTGLFPCPPSSNTGKDWSRYRYELREALDRFSETQSGVFDLIVVDEAQDLDKEDILSLYNLSGGERKIVVFSDKDQTIFSTEWDFSPSDFGEVISAKLVLDENWRNSEPIHEHFKNYAEHDPPITMICDCVTPVVPIRDVKSTLQKLLQDDRRNPHDIVILSPEWSDIKALVGPIGTTGYNVACLDCDMVEFRKQHTKSVLATTIQGFKGLESRIVILILGSQGLRTQDEWDKLRYVGESRAKYELYIVSTSKA